VFDHRYSDIDILIHIEPLTFLVGMATMKPLEFVM